MTLSDTQIKENDRRFLLDFVSLGASVHSYTAVGLYHEFQRIYSDPEVATADKPKIQSALRAKIFAEAVASMETVGKLLYAIRHRSEEGIAYRYVNGTEGQSEKGLRLFKTPGTSLLTALHIPPEVPLPPSGDVQDLANMSEYARRLYVAYLAPDKAGIEKRHIVEAYRAIKHGSNLVCDPRTVSIWSGEFEKGHVWLLTRWPRRNQGADELETKEINLTQESTLNDLEICRMSEATCGNLCQLIVTLLTTENIPY